MNQDFENLDQRYLEVALRDQLGPQVDLTQRVLRAAGGTAPARQRPQPFLQRGRRSWWSPLAAAAAVVLAAGIGVYVLVQVLPPLAAPSPPAGTAALQPAQVLPARGPEPSAPQWRVPALPAPVESQAPQTGQPDPGQAASGEQEVRWPVPGITDPVPAAPRQPAPEPPKPGFPPGMTDPPEAWPGKVTQPPEKPNAPATEPATEPAAPAARALLCIEFKTSRKEGIKLAQGKDWRVLAAGETIRAGDRLKVTGWADFTLLDGTLLRLDGEMVLESADGRPGAELLDGALYADTAAPLLVRHETLKAVVNGMAMLEQRLHSVDVSCLLGSVSSGESALASGRAARLGSEGFVREKAVSFADLQRENRFLKDAPARQALHEDFNVAPGEIEGGAIADGVLVGKGAAATGTIAALRRPVTLRGNEVVRLRFRVDRRTEVVLQFATAQGNYRHIEMNPEPGKWQEVEIPVGDFFKATAPDARLGDGIALLRFQIHDNESQPLGVEVDWLEILSRP